MRRRVKRHQIGVSPFIFVPLKKKTPKLSLTLSVPAEKPRFGLLSCGDTDVIMVYFARRITLLTFEVSRFDGSAKIIMVAALWPVMKVAEVTSESRPGGLVLFIRALKHYNNQKHQPKKLDLFFFMLYYTSS